MGHFSGSDRGSDSNPWESKTNKKPKIAKFIRHVNLADKHVQLRGGSEVIKTWSVKNISKEQWPEGCKLIFIRGDEEASAKEEFEAPRAEPGIYNLQFQLASGDRITFGPRLRMKFKVVDTNKEPDQENKEPDQENKEPDQENKEPDQGNKEPDQENKEPDQE